MRLRGFVEGLSKQLRNPSVGAVSRCTGKISNDISEILGVNAEFYNGGGVSLSSGNECFGCVDNTGEGLYCLGCKRNSLAK